LYVTVKEIIANRRGKIVMSVNMKKLILQSRKNQARLKAIKRILGNIPKKAPNYEFYENTYWDGVMQGKAIGRAELAAELRKELSKVPVIPDEQPENTESGKK
jgi:predicted transcriptional regulator